jgi:hypothetical protein
MGRRTSGQSVGFEKIGNVSAMQAMLSTTQANQDLTLDPNGTGGVLVNGDITIFDQGDLRLRESSGNGTNYIAQHAASTMTANYTITWPAAVAGTNGFVLSSDTSGNLSWSSPGGIISVADPGATATVHYPLFGTNAGAVPTSLAPNARSNLSFVPSTGELTASIMTAGVNRGSNLASGTLTIRGTGNATKATASILMDENVTSSSTATGTLVITGGMGVSGQATVNTLSATTITETSSITYKENINPISDALDKITNLQGYIYDRKDGSRTNEPGLIAEEVEKVIPGVITYIDGKVNGITYTKLIAYLVESVKELNNEIRQLKGVER